MTPTGQVRRKPDTQSPYEEHYLALATLATALGLTSNLNPPATTLGRPARALREIVGTRANRAIREVAAALQSGRVAMPH